MTAPSPSYDNSVIVGDDPSRTGIEPLGVGEGWVASRHTTASGARVTSLVLAEGAVEVRAFRVSGAPEGTAVRVTGWAAGESGARAELQPVRGLLSASEGLTGVTAAADTVFVALARLTAEPEPVPLGESVAVTAVDGTDEIHVRWSGGREVRARLDDGAVAVRTTRPGA